MSLYANLACDIDAGAASCARCGAAPDPRCQAGAFLLCRPCWAAITQKAA